MEELIKVKREITQHSPNEILIYSKPKMGKTDLVSRIEDCGIIELERGAEYVSGYVHNIDNLKELDQVLTWLEKENPYKYIAFDTMTRLEEWCEIEGTLNYMNSVQGKSFNRVTLEHVARGIAKEASLNKQFPVGHVGFESVNTLGQGYGYKWSRESYQKWFLRMKNLKGRKLFLAHIKDKLIDSKNGDQVQGRDIDLTGKLKTITASFVDTIAYLYRGTDGNTYLSFKAGEAVAEGSRSKHLTGQEILIGEWDKEAKDYSKLHWDKIYID